MREERILLAVDTSLATLADVDHLDSTVTAVLAADKAVETEPKEVTRAQRLVQRLEVEFDRVLAAIRAGLDQRSPRDRPDRSRHT